MQRLMMLDSKESRRFWAKVDKTSAAGCWLWTAYRDEHGYGAFWYRGTMVNAHRVSLMAHLNRALIGGEYALHDCPGGDNPSCVNPAHLRLGSHLANMRDKVAKGRQSCLKGEDNPESVLSSDDVIEMRRLFATGRFLQREMAEKYSITTGYVSEIIRGDSWRHLPVIGQGRRHFRSPLGLGDIETILQRLANCETQALIALEYGVDPSVISNVAAGRNYRRFSELCQKD